MICDANSRAVIVEDVGETGKSFTFTYPDQDPVANAGTAATLSLRNAYSGADYAPFHGTTLSASTYTPAATTNNPSPSPQLAYVWLINSAGATPGIYNAQTRAALADGTFEDSATVELELKPDIMT